VIESSLIWSALNNYYSKTAAAAERRRLYLDAVVADLFRSARRRLPKSHVGNELVHAGSHARPQAVDKGMPSQGGSTE